MVTKPTGNPVGAPKKTLENALPEGWKEKMMQCAKDGASQLEVRVEILGISTDLWYRFISEEPEFSETVKICSDLCQSYWERLGRQLSGGDKEGSAATWIFNMKNRFGWKDKSEITNRDGNPDDGSLDNVNWDDPEAAHKAWQESQQENAGK